MSRPHSKRAIPHESCGICVRNAPGKEIERLTVHVERHTDRLLQPSQMALLVSELSGLQSRAKSWQGDKT